MIADSSVIIDVLRNDQRAIDAVKAALPEGLCTTEVNVFELVVGANLTPDPLRHMEKIKVLISMMTILPLDRKASVKAGEISADLIKRGVRVEDVDCMIAGIALVNNVPRIMTKNKTHFERFPGIEVVAY